MASIFPPSGMARRSSSNWHRKMGSHVAAALIAFTGLQIYVISTLVSAGAPSLLYYAGFAILIIAAIPAARNLDRRWEELTLGDMPDSFLAARFRGDLFKLWGGALLLPLLWLPVNVMVKAIGG